MAMRHVHEDVGSDDYKYWRVELKDISDEELEHGRKAAGQFSGYLTLGAFRDLCKPAEKVPYHQPYNPNQITDRRGVMTPAQRKAAMAKLREKLKI